MNLFLLYLSCRFSNTNFYWSIIYRYINCCSSTTTIYLQIISVYTLPCCAVSCITFSVPSQSSTWKKLVLHLRIIRKNCNESCMGRRVHLRILSPVINLKKLTYDLISMAHFFFYFYISSFILLLAY